MDGQECYYLADDTKGVVWHLRYRAASASAYKWEVLEASALFSEVVTNEGTAGGASAYGTVATAGPSITPPLSGDYDVGIGGLATPFSGSAAMSYSIGAAAAVDADSIVFREDSASSASGFSASRFRRKTLVAGDALVAKYKAPNAITIFFGNRWMSVKPVRVG